LRVSFQSYKPLIKKASKEN
ncbi:hypothetical protein CARUB_v100165481mg, partial [Capsella rubella]